MVTPEPEKAVKIIDADARMQTIDYMFPIRPEWNILLCGVPRNISQRELHRLTMFLESIVLDKAACPECDTKATGRIINYCLDCEHRW